MLLPGKHVLTIIRGVSWDFTVQWLVTPDETPVDLTGWTGHLLIKKAKQDEQPLLACSTANGRLTLDEDGYVRARLSKELVDTLPIGTFAYELELFNDDDSVQLLADAVKVVP